MGYLVRRNVKDSEQYLIEVKTPEKAVEIAEFLERKKGVLGIEYTWVVKEEKYWNIERKDRYGK